MKSILIGIVLGVSSLMVAIEESVSQTRFQQSDTVPNYSDYKYIDECLTAVVRLTNKVTNKDTIRLKVMPDEVVKYGRECLSKVNIDTVSADAVNLRTWGQVLLAVNRDEDFRRLFKRIIDSSRTSAEWSGFKNVAFNLYAQAIPVRIDELNRLIDIAPPNQSPEASALYKLQMQVNVALIALSLGDTEFPKPIVTELLGKIKEGKAEDKEYFKGMSLQAFALLYEMLQDEGMDSLRISTVAYRNFLENIWTKLTDKKLDETNEAIGVNAPKVEGKFWYKNDWYYDEKGKIVLSSDVKPVASHIVPVPGKINALLFLSGGCHSLAAEATMYGRKIRSVSCWQSANMIKRLKQEFPDLEVTVISRTQGLFGGGPPLKHEEEAKEISHYFLGFFQIPGVQVISETEFIRIPGLDRRRIDMETKYQEEYSGIVLDASLILVDEYGKIFHNTVPFSIRDRRESIIRNKLKAVFSRINKQ